MRILLSSILSLLLLLSLTSSKASQSVSPFTLRQCDSILQQCAEDIEYGNSDRFTYEKLFEALSVAKMNHWAKQEILALNNVAILYGHNGEWEEAINQFSNAYNIAVRHKLQEELCWILNNMGMMALLAHKYNEAVDYYLKAYSQIPDTTIFRPIYLFNIAEAYMFSNNYDKASEYITKTEKILKPENVYLNLELNRLRSELDLRTGKPAEALEIAYSLIQTCRNARGAALDTRAKTALTAARAAVELGRLSEAESFVNIQLADERDTWPRSEGFELLAAIRSQRGDFNKALQLKDSVIALRDTFYNRRSTSMAEIARARFESLHYQHEVEVRETRIKNIQYGWLITGLVLLILILLLLWGARNRMQRVRQQNAAAEALLELTKSRLEKQNLEANEQKRLLEQQLIDKDRELAANALVSAGKSKILADIVKGVTPGTTADDRLLKELRRHINADKDWESFMALFEQTHHDILGQLKTLHPTLNSNDLRFLTYEYMNLSTKEIATLLNISLPAARKRRERIVRKLELNDSQTLHSYLYSLIQPE